MEQGISKYIFKIDVETIIPYSIYKSIVKRN